jgi:hypothetical protein
MSSMANALVTKQKKRKRKVTKIQYETKTHVREWFEAD